MKKTGKAVISFLLALAMLIGLAPAMTLTAEAATLDLSALTCRNESGVRSDAVSYMDTMMKHYINSDSNLQTTLSNGLSVVFLFEGGSKNYSNAYKNGSGTPGSVTRNQAITFVVQKTSHGVEIVFSSSDCSTVPDWPHQGVGQQYNHHNDTTNGSTTKDDGIYAIRTNNIHSAYGALQLANDVSGSSYGDIFLHTRKNLYGNWGWSHGCLLVGYGEDNSNSYNEFMKRVLAPVWKTDKNMFIKYVDGDSKNGYVNCTFTLIPSNYLYRNVGYVVVNRYLAHEKLINIYPQTNLNTIIWDSVQKTKAAGIEIPNLPDPPAKPAKPTASWGTNNSINLSWGAVQGATYYQVEYSHEAQSWTSDSDYTDSTATSYVSSTTGKRTYYSYHVRAGNAGGLSDWSEPVTLYTAGQGGGVPLAPTGLTGTKSGSNVNLTWNAVSGATSYAIQYCNASSNGWQTPKESPASTNSATITSFGWGYDYIDFRVWAQNQAGTSNGYSEVRVYKNASSVNLPYPDTLSAVWEAGNKATLSWSSVPGATYYQVEYKTKAMDENGEDWKVDGTNITGTSFTSTGLKNHDYFLFQVKAGNASGTSPNYKWIKVYKTITATFDANGGTTSETSRKYTYDSATGTPATFGTLPTPSRTGYSFDGWYTKQTGGTKITSSTAVTATQGITLYAHWTAATYTITYNANGGTGAPAAQTKTHGTALTLSSTKPSRTSSAASSYVVTLNTNGGTCSAGSIEATRLTDYSFKNWNTKADGTGTAYSSGASYTTDASATLYAQWSSTTKTKSVTLPTPVRSGYTFLGWEESGNSSARFTESYTPGGNVTLNAVWQDNTFSVDINGWLDGAMAGNIAGYGTVDVWINGEKVADDVTDYSAKWPAGTSYEVKDIKATQGHAYVGVADGTLSGTVGEGYTGIRLSFSTQYTVSFDANGGDVSTANKTVLLGGKYGTLPVPSREGYRFTGWYSENALITASTVVSKDAATALTAHWEAISAEEVHLNKTTAELVVGDKVILEATITPADALNKTVTWSSSDNSVATVNQTNGEVTAVGAGTATITATAADGSRVSASCRIVVKKSLDSYTVSFDANGGSSAPDPLTKTEGTAIVLPAAIPERSGYTFLGWSESDAATVADYAAGGSLNKDADIVLYAIWKKNDVPADAAELVIESVVARAGDTVKVTYVLKNSCELKSIALFNLTYNSDALELVSGEWKVTDTVLQNWNSTTTNGAVAFDENSKVDGEIFAATFKVKDGTGDGDYRISCDITAKTRTEMGTEEAVEIVTVDGGVTVISYISGDVDDDGNVTSDDAIYVLYYTLLPDMYPVNQPVDFDGDGQITSDDAIYLLYYTLLPDLYPLS